MSAPFGDHQLQIPYEPVADLLAKYARRDPDKPAIVDLDSGTAISFGQLERVVIDIAADLKTPRHPQGQPRAAAVRRQSRNAADLARRLAARRRGLPVQPRNEREADGAADRDARPRADRLSQGDRSGADGRRPSGAAHPLRPVVGRGRPAIRRTSSFARSRLATPRSSPSATRRWTWAPSSAPRAPPRGRRSSCCTTPSSG